MLKLVEKGTKWERLQARKAKAQARTALPETAEKQETWWQRLIRRR